MCTTRSPDGAPLSTLQIGMTASRRHTSGTDRYYLDLLRALPLLGVRVHGVVLGDPAGLDDPVPGLESFAPEDAPRLRRWAGVRRAVSRLIGETNLVVSHGAPHVFPALDQIRIRPLVVHFHGPWALEGSAEGVRRGIVFIRSLQERAVYARAERFIVLSRAFAEILQREYRISPAKIRIVPGGVDLSRFAARETREEARRRLGWPTDRRIVVAVRRLVPSKGLHRFIGAIAALRSATPDILAFIVGSGPLLADLQRHVREHRLEPWIRFTGYVSDDALIAAYRAADLAVVPTLAFEGFGLAAVEALATGTPVLVTPIGGLTEVVADLDPGLILPGVTISDIAEGIRRALGGELTLPRAQACIAHARRFGWPLVAQRIRDVYREVA